MLIVLISILVLAGIATGSYYLYKIVLDQRTVIEQTKDNDAVRPKVQTTVKVADLLSDGRFESLLSEASTNLNKLETLRVSVQNELRKAVKEKNVVKSRTCNEYLKRIDVVERSLQS